MKRSAPLSDDPASKPRLNPRLPAEAVPSAVSPEEVISEARDRPKSQKAGPKASTPAPASKKQKRGTKKNSKNFAEKLMDVLQTGVAKEVIWWEGDGTIVALHVDKLKHGPTRDKYFDGVKYKFFIRKFSRW
jgi:hypothetical protein